MIDKDKRLLFVVFFFAFLYAFGAFSFAREFLIPNVFPRFESGTIGGDPEYYHQIASAKVIQIRDSGIGAFELRPSGQGPAGVASLIYLLHEGAYGIVLLNAFLHAVSVAVLFWFLTRWFSPKISAFAILPLALSPHMFVWFSQLNKDSFATTGSILFVCIFINLLSSVQSPKRKTWALWLFAAIGVLLIAIVRPYLNQVLLPFVLICLVFGFCKIRSFNSNLSFVKLILLVLLLPLMGTGATSDRTISNLSKANPPADFGATNERAELWSRCINKIEENSWERNQLIPDYVDSRLRVMMGQRCNTFSLLSTETNYFTLKSIVDFDLLPGGAVEAIAYIPRAAVIGTLSPLPSFWFMTDQGRPSFFFTAVAIEAILLYVGLLSLIFWVLITRSWLLLGVVFISVAVMTVYGMSVPYLGALYRYRYPFWMLLICIGMATFFDLTLRFNRKKRFALQKYFGKLR